MRVFYHAGLRKAFVYRLCEKHIEVPGVNIHVMVILAQHYTKFSRRILRIVRVFSLLHIFRALLFSGCLSIDLASVLLSIFRVLFEVSLLLPAVKYGERLFIHDGNLGSASHHSNSSSSQR